MLANWINQKTSGVDEQFTSLHFAAFNGNLSIIKILMKYGGNIQAINNQNINCMHFAA